MKNDVKKLIRPMLTTLAILALVYGLVCTGMFLLQRKLMYFPVRAVEAPAFYGLADMREITLTSRDGTSLQAWEQPAKPGFPTIVYFHGNAANHSMRAQKFAALVQAGFGLVAVHYRGYGRSGGSPSESGIYDDARAAIEFARMHLHVPASELVLFGESLGSGVAVQMATEYDVAALILEAPYTSVEGRAAELYPYLPTRLILKDKFYSEMKIKSVRAPLLIVHGEKDAVIPITHGRKLYGIANEPKAMIVYPETGHTDYNLAQLVPDIIDFLRRQKVMESATSN